MPFISIATFIVTIGFALVCIYIARLLLRVAGLIKSIGQTIDEVERQLDHTVLEAEQLILGIERTATDVGEKLQATTGIFTSVQEVGKATSLMSEEFKNRTKSYGQDRELLGTKPFIRSIQWGEYASVLFKAWHRGKKVGLQTKQQK
ncbi:DUF948 domain-containing protein [Sporosarcina pasteurii]|uniref:Uncharacterized protein containing a divergent version of the methyl-accepting chemotaxis-like domain n=1 Tax=Sporosarcina pasteurii TaxID=1474 RepID=A0A380BUU6_SPOPA|nr:DUF948 domain-containing protein [Sporosarcina pasteurii]MDS9471261.1 DUF948 domain-containing protein [Sporosarcina pasteurii]QBQ05107.1 DUF948 domain-containing protein [Sporosarcina pasteurii]SUJ06500.1 Uncharacterized protein containing a divergent version of the methyl-accepting chemotaxis-like domain [Sporosarcina pasteurii]